MITLQSGRPGSMRFGCWSAWRSELFAAWFWKTYRSASVWASSLVWFSASRYQRGVREKMKANLTLLILSILVSISIFSCTEKKETPKEATAEETWRWWQVEINSRNVEPWYKRHYSQQKYLQKLGGRKINRLYRYCTVSGRTEFYSTAKVNFYF